MYQTSDVNTQNGYFLNHYLLRLQEVGGVEGSMGCLKN